MNVLVIPEDFRKDQYILKPIVEAMFRELGRPRAKVRVCQDPLLGGIDQARNWERLQEVLERYRGMVDVFLLVVDRDGKTGRRTALDNHEQKARAFLPAGRLFLAENAWQEVEVWVLAGHTLPKKWDWREIRNDPNSKETYFEPFARERQLLDEPGQGRKTLALEAAAHYSRIRARCREDVALLHGRLAKCLDEQRL
jgi:hypothetical protein